MTVDLVLDSLDNAVADQKPEPGVVSLHGFRFTIYK